MVSAALAENGWALIAADKDSRRWAATALAELPEAMAKSVEPLRCGGTWFVGVDALGNSGDGALGKVPFPSAISRIVQDMWGRQTWHRAQLSVIMPGYPRPSTDETPAAFAYRRERDGAHVDGLLPVGPARRRMIKEPHGFILGIALNETSGAASPLALWESSHKIMASAFRSALAGHDRAHWGEVDVTDAYQEARRLVFAQCQRKLVPMRAGDVVLLDRHLLHGVSAWGADGVAPSEGRAIAYLRPILTRVADWV